MSLSQTIPTTTVGFGEKQVSMGKVGHGLMLMTFTPTPVSDEQAFESIKASLDMVPKGSKMHINSGEFYGKDPTTANLELVARFFEKCPQYADKAFLSVKGGMKPDVMEPDSSPQNLRRSVDTVLEKLNLLGPNATGKKKLDLFQCARVDPKVPVEDAIKTLSDFVSEGLFDFIGMSEVKAETLRRAHAIHPIAVVEIEVSPWSYTQETKDVLSTSAELGIAVAAYSPLGHGFLSGTFESPSQLPDGDFRRFLARFQEENIVDNKAIADGIRAIAAKRGITPAQLCIAWVSSLGDNVIPIPGSSKESRTRENTSAAAISLTPEEISAVNKVLEANPVKGGRHFAARDHLSDAENHLWS